MGWLSRAWGVVKGVVRGIFGAPAPQNDTLGTAQTLAKLQSDIAVLKAQEEHARRERELQQLLLASEIKLREQAERYAEDLKKNVENITRERPEDEKARKEAEEKLGRAKQEAEAAAARERKAQEDKEQAEKKAKEEKEAREKTEEEFRKVKEQAEKGIPPKKWPTQKEIATARAAVKYNPELLHFAICGTAGSGKSSLINGVRGVLHTDPRRAAAVGVVESTLRTTRYPDPRKDEFPFDRFVWYDIPGAGTLNIPDWQYFIDQSLFIFDFIVMVYDIRFTKIDVGIIDNCLRFKIPVFVVRSKADQHIDNMVKIERRKMEEEDDGNDDDDDDRENTRESEKEILKRCRESYIQQTRENFRSNLGRMAFEQDGLMHPELRNLKVYIVSSDNLYRLMTADSEKKIKRLKTQLIDEWILIKDMVDVAISRRYPGEPQLEEFRSRWRQFQL